MTDHPAEPHPPARQHTKLQRVLLSVLAIALVYTVLAYLVLPAFWTHYEHQKGLAALPMVTRTAQDIPGDAINAGLIGNEKEVLCAMNAAKWFPADPVTFRSSIEIAGSVLLDRAYPDAPASRCSISAAAKTSRSKSPAVSADRHHHVRFWKVLDKGEEQRPVWLGAVTFDKGVGVSHFTGAVTHHIDADIDAERDHLVADIEEAGMATAKYQVTGVGPTLTGRNGGGDPYYTDGEVWISRLVEDCRKQTGPVATLPSPPATELKDQIWHAIAGSLPN